MQELPDSSDDIESDNLIKRYQRRPHKLNNLCLADFAAWYNCKKQNSNQNTAPLTSDDFEKKIFMMTLLRLTLKMLLLAKMNMN